jgi:hypothetical protein
MSFFNDHLWDHAQLNQVVALDFRMPDLTQSLKNL